MKFVYFAIIVISSFIISIMRYNAIKDKPDKALRPKTQAIAWFCIALIIWNLIIYLLYYLDIYSP